MLRKSEIERLIKIAMEDVEKIGLQISELKVIDPKVIRELETVDKRGILKRKPIFISPKNYKRIRLDSNEYGRIYGIKLIK